MHALVEVAPGDVLRKQNIWSPFKPFVVTGVRYHVVPVNSLFPQSLQQNLQSNYHMSEPYKYDKRFGNIGHKLPFSDVLQRRKARNGQAEVVGIRIPLKTECVGVMIRSKSNFFSEVGRNNNVLCVARIPFSQQENTFANKAYS